MTFRKFSSGFWVRFRILGNTGFSVEHESKYKPQFSDRVGVTKPIRALGFVLKPLKGYL